jgi:suppressor of G2 allele of SKP1
MPVVDMEAVKEKSKIVEMEAKEQAVAQRQVNAAPVTASTQTTGPTPSSKIRVDFYQSSTSVTITLMAKGVPKDKATVEILEDSLSISFPLHTGSDYHYSLDPLYAKIDVQESSYKIMSTKVEFVLKKATPGAKWPRLEGDAPASIDAASDTAKPTDDAMKRAILSPQPVNTGPSYPTSSKKGPKNWDKLAADLSSKPKNPEAEDNYIEDDDEADPVNGFFKKLYKDADPDTRRAMIKSYQESNGTALSTNWKEVGAKKMETSPPDGMVAKKWDE